MQQWEAGVWSVLLNLSGDRHAASLVQAALPLGLALPSPGSSDSSSRVSRDTKMERDELSLALLVGFTAVVCTTRSYG